MPSELKKISTIFIITLLTFISASGGLFYYELNRKLPEGSYLGEESLSGLNRTEALNKVSEILAQQENLIYEIEIDASQNKSFSTKELGIKYDAKKTVRNYFNQTSWVGHLLSQQSQAQEIIKGKYRPVIEFDFDILDKKLEEFLYSHERDYLDAKIIWKENNWEIKPEIKGILLAEGEYSRIKNIILNKSFPFQDKVQIRAKYEEMGPSINSGELTALLTDIKAKVDLPVVLKYEKEELPISLKEDPNWILIGQDKLIFSLNEDFARSWIENYAISKDAPAGQVTINEINEVVSKYDKNIFKKANYEGSFSKGRKINRNKILAGLKENFMNSDKERIILVEWDDIQPIISSNVQGYEFPQLLSTGVSSYTYGNYPNRVRNIKLSLGSFNGVVLEPGEELSFNRVTGWIVEGKGYTKTQIISEGMVKDGVGGGVCQSSTTMYRAVLNAGLPVTERRNHTLDIVYYHKYGYGLDATVFTESRSDLKFINDFPSSVMVYTYTDDLHNDAYVEFYGTTDHRRVILTNIPTGNWLSKKWEWKIVWPEKEDLRTVISIYQVEKKEEKKAAENPLEA